MIIVVFFVSLPLAEQRRADNLAKLIFLSLARSLSEALKLRRVCVLEAAIWANCAIAAHTWMGRNLAQEARERDLHVLHAHCSVANLILVAARPLQRPAGGRAQQRRLHDSHAAQLERRRRRRPPLLRPLRSRTGRLLAKNYDIRLCGNWRSASALKPINLGGAVTRRPIGRPAGRHVPLCFFGPLSLAVALSKRVVNIN